LRTRLLDWLDEPRADAGLALAADSGGWKEHSYAELASQVAGVTRLILDHGIPPGSTISVILPTGLGFPAAFFGCLAAGTVPNPVAPPPHTRTAKYAETSAAILRAASPALVITNAEYCDVVRRASALAGIDAPVADVADGDTGGGPVQIRPPGKIWRWPSSPRVPQASRAVWPYPGPALRRTSTRYARCCGWTPSAGRRAGCHFITTWVSSAPC